jgi:hypothetical protein
MGSKNAILKTLLYSDIFDYPLTKKEIWRYLISNKKSSYSVIEKDLKKTKGISSKSGLFFLKGKGNLINLRKEKEKESLIKLKKAEEVVKKLSRIPTVKFIGISGSVALRNAVKEDDIDLFIIVQKNTIWITRFAVVIFLIFLGKYRKRGDKNVKDKICTNLFIDESYLHFSKERQDLFTAHELSQLMPIVDKDNIYGKLVSENKWVINFLPNSLADFTEKLQVPFKKTISGTLLQAINNIVKFPQNLYMKKYKTKEEISDKILAFHPQSNQHLVLKKYKEKLRKYNL